MWHCRVAVGCEHGRKVTDSAEDNKAFVNKAPWTAEKTLSRCIHNPVCLDFFLPLAPRLSLLGRGLHLSEPSGRDPLDRRRSDVIRRSRRKRTQSGSDL